MFHFCFIFVCRVSFLYAESFFNMQIVDTQILAFYIFLSETFIPLKACVQEEDKLEKNEGVNVLYSH